MLNTLYTSAQVLHQTHQWKLRLIVTLVKIHALLLDCSQEFEIIPSLLSAQSQLFNVHTLMYGSEARTLSNAQEEKINTFYQQYLSRILRIRW